MNAKFEKWAEREGLRINRKGDLRQERYGQYCSDDTQLAHSAWQAAIQSLEVTPELVTLTTIAYTGFEPHPHDVLFMEQALKAFLSALKEQAK